MKTTDFVTLLQNEFILPRDPHLADRFAALLEENYLPRETTTQEPSAVDPTQELLGGDSASWSDTDMVKAQDDTASEYDSEGNRIA